MQLALLVDEDPVCERLLARRALLRAPLLHSTRCWLVLYNVARSCHLVVVGAAEAAGLLVSEEPPLDRLPAHAADETLHVEFGIWQQLS